MGSEAGSIPGRLLQYWPEHQKFHLRAGCMRFIWLNMITVYEFMSLIVMKIMILSFLLNSREGATPLIDSL